MVNTIVFNGVMKALEQAVKLFGTQASLAAHIGVSQSHIAMWFHRGRVPAEYCPRIEQATQGKVTCERLRPDVAWGVLRESVKAA